MQMKINTIQEPKATYEVSRRKLELCIIVILLCCFFALPVVAHYHVASSFPFLIPFDQPAWISTDLISLFLVSLVSTT